MFNNKPVEIGESVELDKIFFDVDKSELLLTSIFELNNLLKFLNENTNLKVEISGHTDNSGNESHNLTLSNDRAKSVADYLIMNGISKKRISSVGYGGQKPIIDNSTEENRQINRRVEFKIVE